MAAKQCSWEGCGLQAAYGTRTKPAWCDAHITILLRQGGLQPLESFSSPSAFRLTRCIACGCEAHYRFVYTLDKNAVNEPTCRCCYWSEWSAQTIRLGGVPVAADIVSDEEARTVAEAHGYDYLGPAPLPPSYRVRCRYCGRITAERLGDIEWGCSCQVNPRRSRLSNRVPGPSLGGTHTGDRLTPELVEQWHPTLNGPLEVHAVSPVSRRLIHWRDPVCGHEWVATPAEREKRERLRCPECRTILDSLAWHFPELAAEWSTTNPLTAWHVRPSGSIPFVPEWVCPDDDTHRWRIGTNARVNGSTCPQCRETGKSMVELRYFEAVRAAYGEAFSGMARRSDAFTRRKCWVPDITVPLANGQTLLLEYDGHYWHSDKAEIDLAKTRDLLASGALVVRLREKPLEPLGMVSDRYLELEVSPTAVDIGRAVDVIRSWTGAAVGGIEI